MFLFFYLIFPHVQILIITKKIKCLCLQMRKRFPRGKGFLSAIMGMGDQKHNLQRRPGFMVFVFMYLYDGSSSSGDY